ncbi:MAG: PD-(D/E)XK nuclease family protein [Clostridiales bacterium]|nr:PD-(D/E)XK nuclease family protein [Clostridiales bacterium]
MGRVKIIGDRSGRVWPLVLRTAQERREAGRRLVLYVPEQMTLQAERDLIAGLDLPGLLEMQVISPRKLRQQVRERMGTGVKRPLNEMGRAMAVHRVMTEQAGNLAYYKNMTDLPGAVKRVGGALDELRESEITPEELADYAAGAVTGAERAKLGDLQRIWDGYQELITEQFEEEKTVWTDTVNRLERSGLWDGADLAVYGFDTVRPDLRELLVRLCGRVNSAAVFLTMDGEEAPDGRIFIQQRESVSRLETALAEAGHISETIRPKGERAGCAEELKWLDKNLFALNPAPWTGATGDTVSLYAGSTPWDETEMIAATLRRWHAEGIAWSNMAVALPAGAAGEGMLRAGLKINGIPCVWQQKDRAADHPVCRMLLGALSCLSDGYRTEQVITVARSGYCTLTEEEGLLLTMYAEAHGIDGRRWQKPFTAGKEAERIEPLREKLLAPIEALRAELKDARSAAASAEAIVHFLETEQVWNRLQEEEELLLKHEMYREAVINRQVWKLVTDLLEQLWTLMGARRALIRDLEHMLESALETADLAALPEQEGGVAVGEAGHLLAGRIDALILPRAQDGMLTAPESGWLTDPERRKLEEATGKQIGISRERGCQIRKYDFYRTLTLPLKKLMVSWSLRGEDGGALQPDGLVTQIKELFPKITERGGMQESDRRTEPVTPRAALDGVGPWLNDMKDGRADDMPAAWKTALISLLHSGRWGGTARRIIDEIRPENKEQKLEADTARKLFMTDRLSVSRLEQFASCPYRHYIDYGLRPVKQETFEFESNDAGTFFHAALERYMKRAGADDAWPDFTPEQVDGYMDAVCAELTEEWADSPLRDDAIGEWTGEGYLRRVRRAAQVLTRFAANSEFRTVALEQSFGEAEGLPPIVMTLTDGSKAAIRGKIDRIDTWENGEGVWLRIVDNKSREKKPDPARMAAGEQLQLMIYLKAAADSMPDARLAGAMYFPVIDREVSTAVDNPDRIEEDRLSTARMKGLVTAREDVLNAMDRDIRPYSVDKVFNQNGTVSKSAFWAVEEKTLRGLMDAAVEKAGELCGRMRSGEIEASPGEDAAGPVCRYCDYHAICRAGTKKGRERDEGITWEQIAGKNTLRENEKQDIMSSEKTP